MKDTIYIKEDNSALSCYASGSGALSFTWCSRVHPRPATSRKVTRAHVERYLALKQNKGKYSDFRIHESKHEILLVPIIERTEDGKLKYKGEVYRHEGGNTFHTAKFLVDVWGEEIETQHWSTRLALVFFLKNEDTIYKSTVTAN